MSTQNENFIAPADVDQLKNHLASLDLNSGLQSQVNQLPEPHIQQMSSEAHQELIRTFEGMTTKNEELVAENNRLKATIETFNLAGLSRTGAIYELLLQRFEELALQNEQLKDKVIDQRTLIRALLRSQVNQRLGLHYNGQGVGGTNSSQSARHFSG